MSENQKMTPGQVIAEMQAELASLRSSLAEREAEVERMQKLNKILLLKSRYSLAENLCPDHRDKQGGKDCLACEIERLTAELASLREQNARLAKQISEYPSTLNLKNERLHQLCQNVGIDMKERWLSECAVEAIGRLAAPLTWSREAPTQIGWYWLEGFSQPVRFDGDCYRFDSGAKLSPYATLTGGVLLNCQIPLPKEPQ